EDLLDVTRRFDDGDSEVEGNRHGAGERRDDAQAGADGDAVRVDADVSFHGAAIGKHHAPEFIIGQNRDLVLDAVQQGEIAASVEPVDERADAAVSEAANAAETAGIEALENRRGVAGKADHVAESEHLLAAAVAPLPNCE